MGLKIRPVCPLLAPLALDLSPRRPILGLVDLAKEVLQDLITARKIHPPPTPASTLSPPLAIPTSIPGRGLSRLSPTETERGIYVAFTSFVTWNTR